MKTKPGKRLVTGILAALVVGVVNLTYIISSAALIFQGTLTSYFQLGLASLLISYVISGLIMAPASSLPGVIVAPKGVLIAILSFISAQILASGPGAASPQVAMSTLLVCMSLTTFLSGLGFFLIGKFRLGTIIRFIPFPLIAGFFVSVGLLLLKSSISVMTGKGFSTTTAPGLLSESAILWGPGLTFGVIAFFVSRRTKHYLTIPVLTLAGAGAVFLTARVLSVPMAELQSLGVILEPAGTSMMLPLSLTEFLPTASWPVVLDQWPRMLSLVLLASLSILLFISTTEVEVDKEIDLERDLKAVGLANMATSLFGGVVIMHEPIDTGIARRLGGSNREVGLLFVLFCLLLLVVGWRIIPFFPRPVMGGLIMFIGLNLFWDNIQLSWKRMSRTEFGLVLFIAAAVAGFDFLWGLAAGLLAAILLFVVNASRLESVKNELSGSAFRSRVERSVREMEILKEHGRRIHIFLLQGYIFFGTAERLLSRIRQAMDVCAAAPGPGPFLLLDFHAVTSLDASALNVFRKLFKSARKVHMVLVVTAMKEDMKRRFNAVVLEEEAEAHFFPTLDHGLSWAEESLLDEIGKGEEKRPLDTILADIFGQKETTTLFREYLEPVHLEENEVLFEAGSRADSFFLIESGRVDAEVPGQDGVSTMLRGMGPGSVFGEIGLYGEGIRTARISATEPARLYRMSYERFQELEGKHPDMARAFHKYIIRILSLRMEHDSMQRMKISEAPSADRHPG